ncbi:alpha/beta hydrolase [Edaphobacter bradus]|uniref:alpha/beta hydrolase n=1 Tax=Edaphobacter bradus TaxID=2259016 RepID=UPI0021DFB0DB|nr:alpha/beta hydrolase [Edaphobacter bradus]
MSLLHRLEPGARAYMQRLIHEDGEPLQLLSVEAARQYMRDSQPTPLEHVSVSIKAVDAAGIPLTIVRPAQAPGPLPAVLYLHGGGWMLGGIETHARIVRELALRAEAAVVFPHYALAPETRFPVAVEQCCSAARWVQSHGSEHVIDETRMAVAGDSAGGNLAAAVALLMARHNGPALRLQALMCPALQASTTTSSYEEFADGLNLTREAMEWFWNKYVPDVAQRLEPTVSPLQAALSDLSQVAPAVIITAECDVLRDDGERYAQRLADAGVAVTAMRLLGTIHNFPIIDDLQESGPAVTALRVVGDALRTALRE